MRRVIVLGSTGSIGTQTLQVLAHLNQLHAHNAWPTRYEVVGLAAGKNSALAHAQAALWPDAAVALADCPTPAAAPRVFTGPDAAEALVRSTPADLVVAAIVGSAGLAATLAALQLGRDVALANKETLVAAGALVVPTALRSGAALLPVDSEHAAVWQCFAGSVFGASGASTLPLRPPFAAAPAGVRRVILTASGGPFRTWPRERILAAGPADALKHPTWSMGAKVTVDSAGLMNKALEIIEAHHLFGLTADQIDAVVHPQSIVHALVEHADGAVLAQLAHPDMRGPIQNALTFPSRAPASVAPLDLQRLAALEFSPPDLDRFPALALAREVILRGGTAGAIVNAANECAVARFLAPLKDPSAPSLPFGRLAPLAAGALRAIGTSPLRDLADLHTAELQAHRYVEHELAR